MVVTIEGPSRAYVSIVSRNNVPSYYLEQAASVTSTHVTIRLNVVEEEHRDMWCPTPARETHPVSSVERRWT